MILLKRLRVENFKLLRRVELDFPRQGSVLVEGLNESGKSTLFESIYYALYGAPLVTEGRGRGNLESAIRYGENAASVELLLEVDETELEIRRALRRGKPTQASLVLWSPLAPEERVSGVQAVNARVVEELGGLDGEALLNSCFVEQKKLSKLEDLSAGQRKDSLRKLLNLEKLTLLGERFRPTVQDERALAEARERLELAEVASRLPSLEAEKSRLESFLGRTNGTAAAAPPPVPVDAAASPSDDPRQVDPMSGREWWESASRLSSARASRESQRRRGLNLFGGAALVALVSIVLATLGIQVWLLGLAATIVMVGLAAAALQSAARLKAPIGQVESDLAQGRDGLLAKIGDLAARKERAEARLGVDGHDLDLEDCRLEVERLARRRDVNRRAAALLEGTMERIVRLVLPNTERNLGQILPLLTAGRYHEARIGDDYQIQVWDDSAGRYVSKSVFSGGARDQFSLALRLAFALATLPQELGTAPGFIFLDEPLSSFDGPRTEALVQLLTAGQVAASFSQIFVISHNRSFDPNAFQYRLVLRDGRIVESNIPA